ncbi:MAG: hypothetical protein IKT40_07505 [Bacilli bacterium]|nr:hypothetical protein [Bacilli bacterium]
MLKYSIKLDNSRLVLNEIIYESLFFSNDSSYISGVTSSDYSLLDGQDIFIQFNNSTEYKKYKVEVKNVYQEGYVIYDNNLTKREYIDFQVDGYNLYNDVNGITLYNEESNYNKFWCYDGIVTIGCIDYIVDKNTNTIELEDDTILAVNDHDTRVKKTLFTIRKEENQKLDIDKLSCARKYPYILLPTIKTDASGGITEVIGSDNKDKYYYLKDNNGNYVLINDNQYIKSDLIESNDYNELKITYGNNNEIIRQIKYEWDDSLKGDNLHIYLSDNKYVKQGDIIFAKKIYPTLEKMDVSSGESCITIYGKKYYESEDTIDFVIVNDSTECQIIYLDDKKNSGYFKLNGKIIPITISGNTAINENFDVGDIRYNIVKRNYININGYKYIIYGNYVTILNNQPLKLIVEEITNTNCVRCAIFDNESTETEDILSNFVENQSDYYFEVYKNLYDEGNSEYDKDNLDEFEYNFQSVNIYNPNSYYSLPIKLETETSNNLHQEYVVKEQFYNKEIEKATNRTIDMEKNVYYPYRKDGNNFNLIDEIIFDLHFRTRDDNWNIIDDYRGGRRQYRSNWNLFDNYHISDLGLDRDDCRPILDLDENKKEEYYQPSDLLGFLNFTDNDIFYQKSKVGKSFLRLLFYDSPDPRTQSLLHTSTIFMNERELYKKYIDNRNKNDYFVSVEYVNDESRRVYDDLISVIDEDISEKTYEDRDKHESPNIIIDENKRLSSRFTVKNMYESSESSEGYYLYMFKEYSNGLHDKPIYLKVEFNHAGEGRTINFFMPTDKDGNLLQLNIDNYLELIKGIPLENLYESMFIKLRTRYLESEDRYVYYLPEGLVKHDDKGKMRFNLYEIKIRDEIINPIEKEENETNLQENIIGTI